MSSRLSFPWRARRALLPIALLVSYAAGASAAVHSDPAGEKPRLVAPADGERLLTRLSALPLETWTDTTGARRARHLGPTASALQAAFDVGDSSDALPAGDVAGVALAAAQALDRRTRDHAVALDGLRRENAYLHARLRELHGALAALSGDRAPLVVLEERIAKLEHAARTPVARDAAGAP